ncbi:MAG: hypothetical protein ACXW34_04670 [Nitrospira sp.]
MFQESCSILRAFLRDAAGSLYHIFIVALSAGIALLLPAGARQFLSFWSRVEHDKFSLIAVEMTAAIVLMLCFKYVHRSMRDRALAAAATGAGLVSFFPRRAREAAQRIKTLKEEQGAGRTVMVIGSSGSGTVVDQVGDLSSVLDKCLEAKVMLVNPFSQDASARMQALAHPAYSPQAFREEVRQSIALLRRLKAIGKVVRLKLYSDAPLVKLVIFGDYLWLQHYHADLDLHTMPEYVLQRNRKEHGLYTLYAHYFMQRWESPEIPEYDLDTNELVYRNRPGHELRRERVELEAEPAATPSIETPSPAAPREPFQLLHARGPYLPGRGYETE